MCEAWFAAQSSADILIMKLYPHQQKFVDANPRKAILNWEMRTGKTLPAALWIDHPCRAGNTFIITPKQNIKDWQRMNTKATIMTKEQFKKQAKDIMWPTALVVDEAHYFASKLFVKGRSALAETMYNFIKANPNMDVLLLTATPVRQDPWSLHTLLCYIDQYYDWKKWQAYFFEKKAMRFLARPVWMKVHQTPMAWFPRDNWRINIRKYLEKHTNIVSLADVVEYLPPPGIRIIKVDTPAYVPSEDDVVSWMHEHQWEQQNKVSEILKLGYKKVIVVCRYTAQIDAFADQLKDDKPVFILDGRTKDPDAVKKAAQDAEECYFIVQAAMGFGWDGWMFGAIIFASMSHSCLDHTQMVGRPRHLKHISPFELIYLIGGRWDQRIYDTIKQGEDFNAHKYMHKDEEL